MSRKARERKAKERNVSAALLFRMFNDHQLESLSDLADIYRKLERAAGYRNMKFMEHIAADGNYDGTKTLVLLEQLNRWRKECDRWGLDADSVIYLARDQYSVAQVMKILRYPRVRVVLHQQCCLTVWSVASNRCGRGELEENIERMSRNDLGLA